MHHIFNNKLMLRSILAHTFQTSIVCELAVDFDLGEEAAGDAIFSYLRDSKSIHAICLLELYDLHPLMQNKHWGLLL